MQVGNKMIDIFLAFGDDLVSNSSPERKYTLAKVVRGVTENQAKESFRSALDVEIRSMDLPGFYFFSNTTYSYILTFDFIELIKRDTCFSSKPCSRCIPNRLDLVKATGFGAMADEIDGYCWPDRHKCIKPSFEVWLINVAKLKSTMMKLRGEFSKAFNSTTGIFTYGETKIRLNGKLEKRLLSVLTNNFNSIVDRDEVYKYVYKGDVFENDIFSENDSVKSPAKARLEEMFKSLKKKFNILGKYIVFRQEKGYGIFSK